MIIIHTLHISVSWKFVHYIHSCDTGRLKVTEIVCGGDELAVV